MGDPRREWMQKNLINFSKENPQLKVVATPINNRHPIIVGEYSTTDVRSHDGIENGLSRQICVKNMSQRDIWEHVVLCSHFDN